MQVATAVRYSEQPAFPVSCFALKEFQHRQGVGAIQPLLLSHWLLLSQQQIQHPTPLHMVTGLKAMVQDFTFVASSLLQGVSEGGKAINGTFVVNRLGKGDYLGSEPSGVGGARAE